MLPTEGGEHIFNKWDDILQKKAFEAWKAKKKQQIAYEIDKIAVVMHTYIFADGTLGAKNARDCSQKQYFDAGMERNNCDRPKERKEQIRLQKMLLSRPFGGQKSKHVD